MKPDDSVYLHHMLDAMAKVETYLADVDEATFDLNTLVQDGVIRQIEIIGEAAKRISAELRARSTHIPAAQPGHPANALRAPSGHVTRR